jgi:hypothetical protein
MDTTTRKELSTSWLAKIEETFSIPTSLRDTVTKLNTGETLKL